MYETIGSPVTLGNVTLKNRIVFAPTTLGGPNDAYLERIEKIAAGGCGMIIIGDVPVLSMPFGNNLYTESGFAFYEKLAETAHKYDCKICAQLHQDDPVVNLFRKQIAFAEDIIFDDPTEEGKYKIDLWETNRRLLAEMGVENIEISGLCTMCDTERFYSHRKMRENRGVMAGVMTLL